MTTPRRALALLALAAACGGSGDGPVQPSTSPTPTPTPSPPPPTSEAVASVGVTPSTGSIFIGATTTLSATVVGTSGATLSGRTITWSTSDANIATVNNGVVTGVNAGIATITATSEGKSGSAAITVVRAQTALVEMVSGDQQKGLTGRALADSFVVRTKTASGQLAPGTVLTWTATNGTLSTTTTTTDANGLAKVQWTAGSGDATITASVPGSSSVTFRANGRASGACLLQAAAGQRMSLGPTDYTLSLRATTPHKIVVLFVDFSDAPASETTQSLMNSVVTPGIAMLREMSYDRVNITTAASTRWYRMSNPSSEYTTSTVAGQRAILAEAMQLADAEMDFSQADAVYVFESQYASLAISSTFNVGQSATSGITADGKLIGNAVTFGQDARRNGPAILAHESGHMFGLVDLSATGSSGVGPYSGDPYRDVGAWSLMSNVLVPGHYLTWEKRKLGFIDESQVDCIDGSGGEEVIITPSETSGGLKLVAVPTSTIRAVVVEVRAAVGIDAGLCSSGVLVYEVNSSALTEPVLVKGSTASVDTPAYVKCGPWADGTYGIGVTYASTTYTETNYGITVTMLAKEANGAYRVRIKRN